jgi:hypothetical protein
MGAKVKTIEATLNWPSLDKPKLPKNGKGDAKYAIQLMFDPGADLSALQAAALEVAAERYGEKAAKLLKTGALASPFGTDWEKKGYPEGTVYINARSKNQPGMVLRDLTIVPGTDVEQIKRYFYSGARVRATIVAFYYDNESKGVGFGLNNIQFLKDGPRLDGRTAATDDFEALPDLEPADLSDVEKLDAEDDGLPF